MKNITKLAFSLVFIFTVSPLINASNNDNEAGIYDLQEGGASYQNSGQSWRDWAYSWIGSAGTAAKSAADRLKGLVGDQPLITFTKGIYDLLGETVVTLSAKQSAELVSALLASLVTYYLGLDPASSAFTAVAVKLATKKIIKAAQDRMQATTLPQRLWDDIGDQVEKVLKTAPASAAAPPA